MAQARDCAPREKPLFLPAAPLRNARSSRIASLYRTLRVSLYLYCLPATFAIAALLVTASHSARVLAVSTSGNMILPALVRCGGALAPSCARISIKRAAHQKSASAIIALSFSQRFVLRIRQVRAYRSIGVSVCVSRAFSGISRHRTSAVATGIARSSRFIAAPLPRIGASVVSSSFKRSASARKTRRAVSHVHR